MDWLKKKQERLRKGWDDYPEGGKEEEMDVCCGGGYPEDPDECPFIFRLESDLANCYYWSGECCRDYIYFVCQWHPMLGILLCHPNHPWSKFERLLMFIVSLMIVLAPSAAIATEVQKNAGVAGRTTAAAESLFLTLVFVTIPDIVIGAVMYQIAILDSRCPNFANSCRCFSLLHKGCFCIVMMIGVCCTLFSSWILHRNHVNAVSVLKPLVIGKLYSMLTWFPIWFLLPCVGFMHQWSMEKRHVQAGSNPNRVQRALEEFDSE